jgi:chromosome segregation ATPase
MSDEEFESETEEDPLADQTIRREKARLLQEYRDLTSHLATLRLQFEQAMSSSSEITTKCSDLSQELCRVKAERDELSLRLRASSQTNLELQHTIEDLKRKSSGPEPTFNFREHKQKHEEAIQKLKNELAAERTQNEQMNIHVENLCQAASCYFGTTVESHQALLNCLAKSKRRADDERQIDELRAEVHSLSRKLKQTRSELAEKVSVANALQAESHQAADQIKRKERDFARQIEELEKQNRNQSNTIDQFTRERDETARELGQKGSQLKCVSLGVEEPQSKECRILSKQLPETTENLNACVASNFALKKKLYKTTLKWKNLRKKSHELEAGIRLLQNEKLQTKAENQRNTEVAAEAQNRLRETQGQIESLRCHNTAKQKEIDRLTDSYAELESESRRQTRELTEAHRERDRMVSQLDRQEALIQDLQGRLDMTGRQFETREKELEQRLSDIARPTDIADIVPISCWTSAELPTELREVVRTLHGIHHCLCQ